MVAQQSRSSTSASDETHRPQLTDQLNAKLAELAGKGYRLVWVTAGPEELEQLFREGGDDAIVMDDDPSVDIAWFQDLEIRPTLTPGLFVYLEGEFEEMSRHAI